MGLAEFARTVTDDNVDDLAVLAKLFAIALLGLCDEGVVEFVGNEVDGAAAEATAHDTRAGYAAVVSHVVEEVEFFAANLLVL